jgi:hypothetical protein
LCALLTVAAAHGAIDGETNTDGFNPAAELYDLAEAQRLAHVARQLELNRFMIDSTCFTSFDLWGPPVGGPPIRQPIGYESVEVGPNRYLYRPLYAEDVAPARPSDLLPTAIEPARAASGPREF